MLDVGLVYDLGVGVYVDADCASKETDMRSVLGAVVTCEGSPVAWLPRTLQCATLSSTEPKDVVIGVGSRKHCFVRGVLSFLMPNHKLEGIAVLENTRGQRRWRTSDLARRTVNIETCRIIS